MEKASQINAVIDFGNTRGKWAIFSDNKIIDNGLLPSRPTDLLNTFGQYDLGHIISAKVGNDAAKLVPALKEHYTVHELTPQTPLPISNRYGTPQTLGMDRLAGVMGAWALFPQQASLVVDLGTCITYDFIDASGNYLGGGISPGMRMRSKAMSHFTSQLPLVENFDPSCPLIGKTTQECLASGAINGLAFEIEGHIQSYKDSFIIFNTLLCGGDASFFETKLKAPIFVRTELVMVGLNATLNHLLTS